MRSRKRRSIYAELAEQFKTDQVLIRKVAHHPFEFIHQKMTDEFDHRPIRLRYLGLFFIKGSWRKQMVKTTDEKPPDNVRIYARLLFKYKGRNRYFLHTGTVIDGMFVSERGEPRPAIDIVYWKTITED